MKALNLLLHAAHLAFIAVSALAWVHPATRPLHLVVQAAVLFSWYVLGIWKGWTYCLLTDVHWRVRKRLGQTDLPETYVQELVLRLTGSKWPVPLLTRATAAVFFGTTALSVALCLR